VVDWQIFISTPGNLTAKLGITNGPTAMVRSVGASCPYSIDTADSLGILNTSPADYLIVSLWAE
jgi:hypothetical protein